MESSWLPFGEQTVGTEEQGAGEEATAVVQMEDRRQW